MSETSQKKFLITAALPYANGMLHFGHIAGSYLPADCYARFRRMNQDQVLFICGSDEYGIAVAISAEQANRTPKEQVDFFHAINRSLFEQLNISFDYYGRTTSSIHSETTKEFFFSLLNNGHIEEKFTEQLYSEKDDKFLADRYVEGTCPKCRFEQARGDECPKCGASFEAIDLINPRSKLSKAPLIKKMTKHYFLRFDHFKDQLTHFLAEKKWKPNVSAFAKHYVEELRERAITRDTPWGIKVPLAEADGKVFYVWFDAPIGYISISKEWAQKTGDEDAWKDFWLDPSTQLIQFLGKDNIPFHAVFFPAMIMGQDIPYKLVDQLPANEFYNLEGKQFSKSSGWTIDLDRFLQNFSADSIRYAIASNAPENSDSEFSWKDFQQRVNADLVGKYGNLVNRVLTFIHSKLPKEDLSFERLDEDDHELIENIDHIAFEILKCFEDFKVRKATSLIMELASLGNAYFDAKKPWALIKDPKKHEELKKVLALCLYVLKVLSLVSYPVIPQAASALWDLLGFEEDLATCDIRKEIKLVTFNPLDLKEPKILFKKIEDEMIEQEIALLKPQINEAVNTEQFEPLAPTCSIGDVQKIDLRVGEILAVEKLEKSKKLLKLTVDIGLEVRTIVSGIALNVTSLDSLIGKKVIIVANLQPAKLMGIESQGMLLAGSLAENFEIPSFLNLPKGAKIS
jgi:methionyl-tRNA synthetase